MSNGYDGPYLAGAHFNPAEVFANAGDVDAAAADPQNAIKHADHVYAAPTEPATYVSPEPVEDEVSEDDVKVHVTPGYTGTDEDGNVIDDEPDADETTEPTVKFE